MTMLPPIWVAAWASQRSRNGRFRKTSIALPGGGAWRRRGRSPAGRHGALGRAAPAAALRIGSPRSTNSTSRRSIVRRSTRTWRSQVRQRSPMSAPSRSTSHVSPPHGCGAPETDDVAEVQRERGSVRHRAEGIKDAARHGRGRGPGASRGRVMTVSIGWTSTVAPGFVAASWAIIPPTRVSEPTSVSGRPIARIVNGSRSSTPSTSSAPGTPLTDVRAIDPDVLDRDRLGAGVAQLVQELLDRRRVDRAADRDLDARAGDGIEPGPGPDPAEVRLELADRRRRRSLGSARSSSSSRSRLAISPRSWSFSVFRLATSTVSSWADLAGERGAAGLGRDWTTTRSPRRHATAAIVSWLRRSRMPASRRAPGAARRAARRGRARHGARLAERDRAGEGRRLDRSGSAHEIPIPNELDAGPDELLPAGRAPTAGRRGPSGPIAVIWYGPAR